MVVESLYHHFSGFTAEFQYPNERILIAAQHMMYL